MYNRAYSSAYAACTDQVDFPTVEPWRVHEDTQTKIPLVLSGFERSAQISVRVTAKFGRLLVRGSDGISTVDSLDEVGEGLTLSGTQDDINLAVETVWYSAPLDWNSRGQNTFETLSVVVDEQDWASGGDPYPGVPRSLVVMVVPVNDPPSLQGPSTFTAVENVNTVIEGIEVFDADAQDTAGGVIKAKVSATEPGSIVGLGSKLGLYIRESSIESKTFHGSLKNVNNALAGLTFRGPFEFSGVTELKVDVDDLGNTGEGGPLSASLSVPIYVSSTNNPPRITREQGSLLKGVEDETIEVDGILVQDQDAGDGRVRLTVEALHGAVSFGGERPGLDFERGNGVLDEGVTVLGTIKVGASSSLKATAELAHFTGKLFAGFRQAPDNSGFPKLIFSTNLRSQNALIGSRCDQFSVSCTRLPATYESVLDCDS